LATQYVLDSPAISSVVTGIRTMEQLLEAIAPKPQPDKAWLDGLKRSVSANRYQEHR